MSFTNNPIKVCRLRTRGLASINGAKFGMTRSYPNGKPKPHQGIDLASDVNFRLYAVEDGEVVGISKAVSDYGYTITIKIDKKIDKSLDGLFAFYAHLNSFNVNVGDKVKAGNYIGLTGDSGNAKGMDTEKEGGHLHFELRTKQICGKGLANRIDPLPYVKLD